jgi:methanol--5-hydroxybenzimidazolylcobamide Co-methyltransferase
VKLNFSAPAYNAPEEMIFGRAMHPVRCGFDLVIGAGKTLPEINFTLPPMPVARGNLSEILKQYQEMVTGILSRLVILDVPGAVIEFEHTPQMTDDVEIGARITEQAKNLMLEYYNKHGLKSALRVTICDIRDKDRPPRMRSGDPTRQVLEAFRMNAQKGADLLSIESTGGKEISDRALMEADVPGLLLALGILAPRDMHFIWKEICRIAKDENVIPAGDTACAFANTAMVLADRKYIPNVLAVVIRAMSSVRSLVAYEEGAIGPSKDCAYEGPVIKAITGYPISMEGKSSACAHFSHVGNIASAVCDLWSNESVQNVKLLSGYAPEAFTEILAYDCRLMNEALANGDEHILKKLMTDSDEFKSVHALIISPNSSYHIAKAILEEESDFQRTRRAGLVACELLREAVTGEKLRLPERENQYLDRIEADLNRYSDEDMVLSHALPSYPDVALLSEYGL